MPAASRKRSTRLTVNFHPRCKRGSKRELRAPSLSMTNERRQPGSTHPTRDRVGQFGVRRPDENRSGDAPDLGHLSHLSPVFQLVRRVSAAVRPDRQLRNWRTRFGRGGRLPQGRRCLHALRHVLHDEVSLCAPARVQCRFSARDAALPGRRAAREKISARQRELAKTDCNGRLAGLVAPLANWANNRRNGPTRPAMEKMLGIDRRAAFPSYHGRTFVMRSKRSVPPVDYSAPAVGRKAILYATCFVNYSHSRIGEATRAVLARNGVETEVLYPRCCSMPQLEQGDLAAVARSACEVAAVLGPRIDKGYDIVALAPSCALMLKFEWPLIVPGNSAVEKLSKATFDNQRVRRRHRSQGRACPRPIAVGGRGCSSPRLPCPRPKYRPKSGRNATVVAWLRHLRDRAVLRPWRALGRAQAKFRDRRQGRGAGRPPSVAERKAVPFLRVSARRHAYPSGDGDGGKRRKPAQTPDASNRTRCPRLRDPRTVV
jgi:Cysteine-rich domain